MRLAEAVAASKKCSGPLRPEIAHFRVTEIHRQHPRTPFLGNFWIAD
jgi:hypothetical protein